MMLHRAHIRDVVWSCRIVTDQADLHPLPLLPEEAGLPTELQASVRRHYKHLTALVESLRAAGVDEAIVASSVQQLLESYGVELTAAMKALVTGGQSD